MNFIGALQVSKNFCRTMDYFKIRNTYILLISKKPMGLHFAAEMPSSREMMRGHFG